MNPRHWGAAATEPKAEFVDFRVMVCKISGGDQFVTVVVDAPVSRWGYNSGLLDPGALRESPAWRDAQANLLRDMGGRYYLSRETAVELEPPAPALPIGHALFNALFPAGSAAYDLLRRSCVRAHVENRCLRLKLELPPEISNLPWEIMRASADVLDLDIKRAKISIMRYLGETVERRAGVVPEGKKKPAVLVIIADPEDIASRDMTYAFFSERNKISNILGGLRSKLLYEVIENRGTLQRLDERARELERSGHRIIGLHFVGHGGVDEHGGYLLGEDDSRRAVRIREGQLMTVLEPAEAMEWVILNGCWTAFEPIGCPLAGLATSIAVLKEVPAVIAYQFAVGNSEAEALTDQFYTEVIKWGQPIDLVVRSIQLRHQDLSGLVLLVRAQEGRRVAAGESAAIAPRRAGSAKGRAAREAAAPARPPTQPVAAAEPVERRRREPDDRRPVRAALATERGYPCDGEAIESSMARVPAGPFRKGLTGGQSARLIQQFRRHGLRVDADSVREALREEQEERIEIEEFLIDLTPVTNAQFRRFVDAEGFRTEAEREQAPQTWRLGDRPEAADHPVVFVTYGDAEAYCRWAGKRLPTADEWKKAFRGPEGRIYPWGEEFDVSLCNTAESQRGWETTPVTRFPQGASPYGCLDMVGNVEEWTASTDSNGHQLVLGGSWCMTCEVYGLPVLHRLARPSFRSNELGFRCVRSA